MATVATEIIPVIDFGACFAGAPGALESTAAELRHALEHVGFFVMTGHGVPERLIEQTFAEAKRFHDQPMDAKLALRMNEHNNGYMMMGRYAVWTSEVNANDKPDLNEAFFCRRERSPGDPMLLRRFAGPNVWPADLPGFRENVLAYTGAMDALSARILPVVARALDLPAGAFAAAFADSQFTFRLSHYPPVPAAPNQFGIAPHTDANFMTFLAQTDVPGLQVRIDESVVEGRPGFPGTAPSAGGLGGPSRPPMNSAAWIDVPYVPGSFAVNSGDMLHRWSNSHLRSTAHRAVPPVGRHRYAIPFFLGPHMDTVIECLPTCQGPDDPPRFPPITYAAYLTWWYKANYDAAVQRD